MWCWGFLYILQFWLKSGSAMDKATPHVLSITCMSDAKYLWELEIFPIEIVENDAVMARTLFLKTVWFVIQLDNNVFLCTVTSWLNKFRTVFDQILQWWSLLICCSFGKFSIEEHWSLTFKSRNCVCFKYLRKFVLMPEHLHSSHEKM